MRKLLRYVLSVSALSALCLSALLHAAATSLPEAARLSDRETVRSLLQKGADVNAAQVRLQNLEGQFVDPFHVPVGINAIVLLFLNVDCPISNRYAPEVQRLYERFASQHVRFWLIYPNPKDSPQAIRTHLEAFGYPPFALRDPEHGLVKLANATVTPEAVVFDRRRQMVYRGRIDDHYVAIGLQRPAPTQHDLEEALLATLAGRPVAQSTTPAVGCFIADFVP